MSILVAKSAATETPLTSLGKGAEIGKLFHMHYDFTSYLSTIKAKLTLLFSSSIIPYFVTHSETRALLLRHQHNYDATLRYYCTDRRYMVNRRCRLWKANVMWNLRTEERWWTFRVHIWREFSPSFELVNWTVEANERKDFVLTILSL